MVWITEFALNAQRISQEEVWATALILRDSWLQPQFLEMTLEGCRHVWTEGVGRGKKWPILCGRL